MMERTLKTFPEAFDSLIQRGISNFLIENDSILHSRCLHAFTSLLPGGLILLADVHQASELL